MGFLLLSVYFHCLSTPTILFKPAFQSAKFGSVGWNRGDAISRLCKEICKYVFRFLWNKIQLHFPF
jgi:hypothetical protein